MTFLDKLDAAQRATRSRLCIGLDPIPARLPAPLANLSAPEAITAFCSAIVDATAHVACAYKPNLAFFEAIGPAGLQALDAVMDAVPENRLMIADAKRSDIGSSARYYASAFFERKPFDAVTISPYMGRDSIEPFLQFEGRAAFALVLTSNPGADDIQLLEIDGRPLYELVAEASSRAADGAPGTLGFVVGATRPDRLASLRRAHPDIPFLVPGVGTQGGDAAAVLKAAGSGPLVVNVGRAIIYASSGADYARAAREAAERTAEALPAP